MSDREQDEKDGRAEEATETAGATHELDGDAPTERRPPVEATAPRPAADGEPAPGPRDVGGTIAGYLRGRAALLGDLARRHRGATVALALIFCAAVALLGVALFRAFAVPDAATVAADARAALVAPEHSGGTYGTDASLVTQGVDVRSVRRSQTALEGGDAQFGASGYATAEVVVSYAGQGVSADQGATLSYALVDGTWTLVPGVANEGVTWRATSGVDQNKVLSNVHLLLARADEADGTEPALAELYADATVSVDGEAFDEDAQTDTLEITCTRAEAFATYECHLTVTFSFSQTNGQWGVSQVEVSDNARERNLDALLGTWSGTFQSQRTEGGKCLAGRASGLSVEVLGTSASDSAVTLSGSVSGTAHYHANPGDDAASCEGDLALEDVPFTATLESGDEGLVFVATLPDDVGGTSILTLRFGTEADPSAAVAELACEFTYDDAILFIPYERTASYTDTFALSRAGGDAQ
ncbi:MAG TPA: hypothetical protein IAA22_06285 [Candidatus Olsenella stercoravium]|uniref:Uncharacterized protein n=1 Tax=Candidatus Olsenella stercoravium TaxID=2838713 RepID=A0A9D2DKQ7_9ACTN|nr:hypothetical protein [Candidatus Olsenella stercoravium]